MARLPPLERLRLQERSQYLMVERVLHRLQDARTSLGLGSTDNVTFNNVEIDGNLNHDGNNIGFFGTTPTTEETVDGPFTQGFDPATATANETALAGAIDSIGQALANYGFITYNP